MSESRKLKELNLLFEKSTECYRVRISIRSLFTIIIYLILSITTVKTTSQQQVPVQQHNRQNDNHCSNLGGQQQNGTNCAPQIKILIPNLPAHQYQFWLRNHKRARDEFHQICLQVSKNPELLTKLTGFQSLHVNFSFEDPDYISNLDKGRSVLSEVCSKIHQAHKSCWGYENHCELMYVMPECPGTKAGKMLDDEKISWFNEVDFGYIHDIRTELNKYCSPIKTVLDPRDTSSFECTNYFRTCRGKNMFMTFNLPQDAGNSTTFKSDILFNPGDIGGWNCDLQSKRIEEQQGHNGHLESWFKELKNYRKRDFPVKKCDLQSHFSKLTFFVKMDSPSDMYDYVSSFINLYATIHFNNRFSDNNQIIVWGGIESTSSKFEPFWSAFTRHPKLYLESLNGNMLCFDDFIFALPSRTIDGLMHRQELTSAHCQKSGLIRAFNEHVLHRLGVFNTHGMFKKIFTVTILSRPNSKLRAIINEKDLIIAIKKLSDHNMQYIVQKLNYNSTELIKSIKTVHNSDLIISTHHDELTYLLFLPDWSSVIEVYNYGNHRYKNLARMRGVSYFTPNETNSIIETIPEKPNRQANVENNKHVNYKMKIDKFTDYLKDIVEHTRKKRDEYVTGKMRSREEIDLASEQDEKKEKVQEKVLPTSETNDPTTNSEAPPESSTMTSSTTPSPSLSTTMNAPDGINATTSSSLPSTTITSNTSPSTSSSTTTTPTPPSLSLPTTTGASIPGASSSPSPPTSISSPTLAPSVADIETPTSSKPVYGPTATNTSTLEAAEPERSSSESSKVSNQRQRSLDSRPPDEHRVEL